MAAMPLFQSVDMEWNSMGGGRIEGLRNSVGNVTYHESEQVNASLGRWWFVQRPAQYLELSYFSGELLRLQFIIQHHVSDDADVVNSFLSLQFYHKLPEAVEWDSLRQCVYDSQQKRVELTTHTVISWPSPSPIMLVISIRLLLRAVGQ